MSIDPAALIPYREVMGDDADAFVIDLIDTYLTNSEQLAQAIVTSFASGDAETFMRSAHTLKSNSAVFGAQVLADFCLELELAGKKATLDGLQPKIDQMKAEYAQVRQELAALRQTLTP